MTLITQSSKCRTWSLFLTMGWGGGLEKKQERGNKSKLTFIVSFLPKAFLLLKIKSSFLFHPSRNPFFPVSYMHNLGAYLFSETECIWLPYTRGCPKWLFFFLSAGGLYPFWTLPPCANTFICAHTVGKQIWKYSQWWLDAQLEMSSRPESKHSESSEW